MCTSDWMSDFMCAPEMKQLCCVGGEKKKKKKRTFECLMNITLTNDSRCIAWCWRWEKEEKKVAKSLYEARRQRWERGTSKVMSTWIHEAKWMVKRSSERKSVKKTGWTSKKTKWLFPPIWRLSILPFEGERCSVNEKPQDSGEDGRKKVVRNVCNKWWNISHRWVVYSLERHVSAWCLYTVEASESQL